MTTSIRQNFRIRSYVGRNSRTTKAQSRAYSANRAKFELSIANGMIDLDQEFGRLAPRLLEIGFGNGQSLLALAQQEPGYDFIGVETHQPGVGALCLGIQEVGLTNLRFFTTDVIDVLASAIPPGSLTGIQIFFPDPWPKRRHHARRLIQPSFIVQCVDKLLNHGVIHLATDWEDYAKHMLRVLSKNEHLLNLAGEESYAKRSIYRPIISKFEQRAHEAGRKIWELQFVKC